jgi:hypothetical protein
MKGSAIPGSLTATLEGDRTQHYTHTLHIQYIHLQATVVHTEHSFSELRVHARAHQGLEYTAKKIEVL